jgi:hypothetical protein
MFRSAIISSGDIKSLKTSQKPFQNPWMGWAWQQHIIQNPGYSAYIWHMYVRTYVRMYMDAYINHISVHETLIQASFQICPNITSITTHWAPGRCSEAQSWTARPTRSPWLGAGPGSTIWQGNTKTIWGMFKHVQTLFKPYPSNIVVICEFKLTFVWCESE